MTDDEIFQSEKYQAYHKKVVDACVKIMSGEIRAFFDAMDYIENFKEGDDPEEVAATNVEDSQR
ncbi:MAG: hypothetical protein KGJ90_02555 [Patescibacteria group bacterium]|nr:hypothetical protein [Patescibacteria group bacterium]